MKRLGPHEESIDELVAGRLDETFRKLPPGLQTPPADVSGTAVGGSIDELPDKLADAVEAAIWEYNKLYNMLCIHLPHFRDRLFPVHLSLNRDGSWHVEEGHTCDNPFDSNHSFFIRPTISREGCRDAAQQALDLCVSYLKAQRERPSL